MCSFAFSPLRRRHVVYAHFAALLFLRLGFGQPLAAYPFFVITGLAFHAGPALGKAGAAPAGPGLGGGALWLAAAWWFYSGLVWTQYTGKAQLAKWGSEGMAAFLRANKAELSGLKLYNYWSWGGWLGWELGPEYKPFVDGRYLFHDRISEVTGLSGISRNGKALIAKYKFDLALIKLDEPNLPAKRRLAGGGETVAWRPAYLFISRARTGPWSTGTIPPPRWCGAVAVPAAWLAGHEFRWLRPGDTLNLPGPLLAGSLRCASCAGSWTGTCAGIRPTTTGP